MLGNPVQRGSAANPQLHDQAVCRPPNPVRFVFQDPPSVVNRCFACVWETAKSLWRARPDILGNLSHAVCILVGNREAPTVGSGTDRTGVGIILLVFFCLASVWPGEGLAGRVSTLRRRWPGVGPTERGPIRVVRFSRS